MPRSRRVPLLGRIRIDDVRAVEPLVNVALQRRGVAVVEVAAEGFGLELVDEFLTDLDIAPTDAGDSVLMGAVDSVKVHGVRVSTGVREVDAQPIAFVGAQS